MEEKWLAAEIRPLALEKGNGRVKVFHILIVGVRDGYKGKGLAGRVLKESLELAASKGFSHAVAEATAVFSQSAFKTLGFDSKPEYMVEYDAYIADDGSRPFEGLRIPPYCKLVTKSL